MDVATGDYEVTVRATGGGATDDITFTLTLISGVFAAPALDAPADGATEVLPNEVISWNAVDNALAYDFELSDVADFSTILLSAMDTERTGFSISEPLDGNVTYYWRVRTINDCGPGEWAAYSFTTADISCAAAEGIDLPAPISDSGADIEVAVDLEVAEAFEVASLEVTIDIQHTYVGDLSARLLSPEGTEIELFGRIGGGPCGGDNMLVTFTDVAQLTQDDFLTTCTLVFVQRPNPLKFVKPTVPVLASTSERTTPERWAWMFR